MRLGNSFFRLILFAVVPTNVTYKEQECRLIALVCIPDF